jgi:hypothetical protein
MAQQLESIKIAAEHRKIIHEIFATRDDEVLCLAGSFSLQVRLVDQII